MSVLTDLRAALDELKDARHANRHSPDDWTGPRVDRAMEDLTALLTDDTIRALLDVAEAMHDENNSSGEAARQAYVRGRTALAPLVKEADHE